MSEVAKRSKKCSRTENGFANCPVFQGLPRSVVDRLRTVAARRTFEFRERVVQQGEECKAFYAVVSGRIRIESVSLHGRTTTLRYIGTGDCFGEVSAWTQTRTPAAAYAMEQSELLVVASSDFRKLVCELPDLSRRILQILCWRVRAATNLYQDSVCLRVEARLAKLILALEEPQEATHADIGLEIQLSQTELADLLGVSRKSVNQRINSWKKLGWVKVARGRLVVVDRDSLRSLAGIR